MNLDESIKLSNDLYFAMREIRELQAEIKKQDLRIKKLEQELNRGGETFGDRTSTG